MKENYAMHLSLRKVHEEQIDNLKGMLNSTINVKIRYENIIKKLFENEEYKEFILNVIRGVTD